MPVRPPYLKPFKLLPPERSDFLAMEEAEEAFPLRTVVGDIAYGSRSVRLGMRKEPPCDEIVLGEERNEGDAKVESLLGGSSWAAASHRHSFRSWLDEGDLHVVAYKGSLL